MKRTKNYFWVVLLMVSFLTLPIVAEEVEFTGDISGVSTYVWRGLTQFDGIAFQGSVSGNYKALSCGLWYSSVNLGTDSPMFETDPFIEISFPIAKVNTTFGGTVYTYDMGEFNADADFDYELYTKLAYGPVDLAVYYVPSQESTKNDPNESTYWVEVSSGIAVTGLDLGVAYGFGTYTSRFLAEPSKDSVSSVMLSVSKSVLDVMTVSWNYSIATVSALASTAWINISREL